jgi:hypothetical protein
MQTEREETHQRLLGCGSSFGRHIETRPESSSIATKVKKGQAGGLLFSREQAKM